MYQALGKSTLIKIVVAIGVAAVLFAWLIWTPETPFDYVRIASLTVTGVTTLIMILGASPLWKLLWWICPFLNTWVFPNVSGEWAFIADSNIKEIARIHPDLSEEEVRSRIKGKVRIRQNLFTISLALDSAGDYSASDTLFVKPSRDETTGRFYLTSVFRNRTPKPKASDEQVHFGAAHIEIAAWGAQGKMKGIYWTNRNWQKGMNTAGIIEMTRPGR